MACKVSHGSADHLGSAAECQAPDVGGDQVDPGVGHSNKPGVSVDQALVINLHNPAHSQVLSRGRMCYEELQRGMLHAMTG